MGRKEKERWMTRKQGLDKAKGGEEMDGETLGLNKKRKEGDVRMRLDKKTSGRRELWAVDEVKNRGQGSTLKNWEEIVSLGGEKRTSERDWTKVMRETTARFVKDYVLFMYRETFFSWNWIWLAEFCLPVR